MNHKTYLRALAMNSIVLGSAFAMQQAAAPDFETCLTTHHGVGIQRFFDGSDASLTLPSQNDFDRLFERAYDEHPAVAAYLVLTPDRYMKPTQGAIDSVYLRAGGRSDVHFIHILSTTGIDTPKPSQAVVSDFFRKAYDDGHMSSAQYILSTPKETPKPNVDAVTFVFNRAMGRNDMSFVGTLLTTSLYTLKSEYRDIMSSLDLRYETLDRVWQLMLIPSITLFLRPDDIECVLLKAIQARDYALIRQVLTVDNQCLRLWLHELPRLLESVGRDGGRSVSLLDFMRAFEGIHAQKID